MAQVTAGNHNSTNETCTQLCINIAGSSVCSPASCQQGYANYAGTVYSCGGSAQNVNCKAQGYKVVLTIYSGGKCPDVSGLNPGSWNSWEDVPEAIANAFRCVPPTAEETFDWSATVQDCISNPVVPTAPVGETFAGADGATYLLWRGSVDEILTPVEQTDNLLDPFLGPYDLAQTGTAEQQTEPMRQVLLAHAPLEGVELTATVRVEHFQPGASIPQSSQAVHLAGRILHDGRFDVARVVPVLVEGERDVLQHHLTFDGSKLLWTTVGAETGNAYPIEHAGFQQQFDRLVADSLAPAYRWFTDPFAVALFPNRAYESTSAQDGTLVTLRHETLWSGEQRVDVEYDIDVSGDTPTPLSKRVFDSSGGLRLRCDYRDFRSIAGVTQRPFSVTETHYLDGDPVGRRTVTQLRIQDALPFTESQLEALSEPADPDQLWFLWM